MRSVTTSSASPPPTDRLLEAGMLVGGVPTSRRAGVVPSLSLPEVPNSIFIGLYVYRLVRSGVSGVAIKVRRGIVGQVVSCRRNAAALSFVRAQAAPDALALTSGRLNIGLTRLILSIITRDSPKGCREGET